TAFDALKRSWVIRDRDDMAPILIAKKLDVSDVLRDGLEQKFFAVAKRDVPPEHVWALRELRQRIRSEARPAAREAATERVVQLSAITDEQICIRPELLRPEVVRRAVEELNSVV